MTRYIPMEDWLRGCVYHDGRKGVVYLPCDKVLEIANYIQTTRTSMTDGLIGVIAPESYREDREEYELATEQMEYDALYETTYNPEDGSM